MPHCDVLVVAGTHGNELNAPWLLEQWDRNPVSYTHLTLPTICSV